MCYPNPVPHRQASKQVNEPFGLVYDRTVRRQSQKCSSPGLYSRRRPLGPTHFVTPFLMLNSESFGTTCNPSRSAFHIWTIPLTVMRISLFEDVSFQSPSNISHSPYHLTNQTDSPGRRDCLRSRCFLLVKLPFQLGSSSTLHHHSSNMLETGRV